MLGAALQKRVGNDTALANVTHNPMHRSSTDLLEAGHFLLKFS